MPDSTTSSTSSTSNSGRNNTNNTNNTRNNNNQQQQQQNADLEAFKGVLAAAGISELDDTIVAQLAQVTKNLVDQAATPQAQGPVVNQALMQMAKAMESLAENQKLEAKEFERKEIKAGVQKIPVWGSVTTAEQDAKLEQAARRNPIHPPLLRILLDGRTLPLCYLTPTHLTSTYVQSEHQITKAVADRSKTFSLTDDYQFAGNWTEYPASLNNFLSLVQRLADGGTGQYNQSSVEMIKNHINLVKERFENADDDDERITVLIYDVDRRTSLFRTDLAGETVNIGRWNEEVWRDAKEKRRDLREKATNRSIPNPYLHLSTTSSSYPPHLVQLEQQRSQSGKHRSNTSSSSSNPNSNNNSNNNPSGNRYSPTKGNSFRGSQQAKEFKGECYVCGESHSARECGKATSGKGSIKYGGKEYCLYFQSGRCTFGTNCRSTHTCCRQNCNSSDHGAMHHNTK